MGKNWSLIVKELRGLYNEAVSKEDDPDADFLEIVELIEQAADALELRYRCSAD